ncbi:MAG: terminase [Rhodococcus sp. (in: high G+C Gram-positive bacteria)]|uniref:terminase n=1 Tax=Rhodococcus sp. TaxID=1831 RepID=UPI002AD882AD|nr:terminase [Rhodococcus sp. (in: high G+C Gram-positive bacteria)]
MTGSTRRLSEVARHLVIPAGIVTSVFPRVYRRLQEIEVAFDEWQQGFGRIALGCRESGKYAASIGGVVASWPRQVGKTYTVGNLLIGLCLEFPGLRVIWTSHHGRTTTNTFRSMQGMVRSKKVLPHIAPNGIRTANGEQEIRFVNGSIIMFGAREQGFGRGMDAIDIEVFDEAQILGLKALEDMVPATNAAKHEHGGLVIFLGTPPRPTDDGEAFTKKRKKAIDGKTLHQVYVEISADPDTDPDDESKFHTFNPSYPHRTPLESMLRMRENIPDDDSWRREAMGIWPADDVETVEYVIEPDDWSARADPEPSLRDDSAIGMDVSPDGLTCTIAAATFREDGGSHLELIFHGSSARVRQSDGSLRGPADMAISIWASQKPRAVVIDRQSPAFAFVPELEAAGVKVIVTNASQMGQACSAIDNELPDGLISHTGDKRMLDALKSASKRPIGTGGAWAWDRRGEFVITPMVAVTLARFGLWAEVEEPQPDSTYEETDFIML